MARRGASPLIGPFALLQRILTDDIASFFGEQPGGRLGRPQARSSEIDDMLVWTPKIDVVQHDNHLVIRADLPGMTPGDVTVEIAEDAIIISGQRRREHAEEEGGRLPPGANLRGFLPGDCFSRRRDCRSGDGDIQGRCARDHRAGAA